MKTMTPEWSPEMDLHNRFVVAIRQLFVVIRLWICYADSRRIGAILDNNKPLLPVKSDFVFRLIFGDQRNVDMLATRSPQMKKAVGVLKELSADEATRLRYEAREKAKRDLESQVDDAVRENDEKWQGVVADKDAEIAALKAQLAGK